MPVTPIDDFAVSLAPSVIPDRFMAEVEKHQESHMLRWDFQLAPSGHGPFLLTEPLRMLVDQLYLQGCMGYVPPLHGERR